MIPAPNKTMNRNKIPILPPNHGMNYLANLSRNSSGDSFCSEEKNLEKLDEYKQLSTTY